ncbi:MAG: DUF4340 domain-containing protein [Planctomycetes bacterium]|nr:DUF4340 domain-containing protein [Planctomycetota bacterium]
MGLRPLAVLVLLGLVLGAVLWFTDEKPPIDKVAEASVLDGRSLQQCKRLMWQFRDHGPIEIAVEADGRFHLREPFADLASIAQLKAIVDAWDSAQMRATPLADDAEGRQKAGLEPPVLRFAAEWPDGQRIDVEVGAEGPLGTTRFLRRQGKIWEGGNGLLENMRVGLDDLRERQVFRTLVPQVREVAVDRLLPSGRREKLHLRQQAGSWTLLEPVAGRADTTMAFRFVTALLSLRVDTFLIGAVRLPEGEPALVVTVTGDRGEEALRLWEQGGAMFGQLPGRDAMFVPDNRDYGAIFENAADALRARILLPFAGSVFETMVECVIDPGQGRGDRVRLVRESPTADWRLVEPVDMLANPTPCMELATAVNRLVAREFVDEAGGARPRAQDARYGLDAARLTVSVRGNGERAMTTLWLGAICPDDAALAFACRADDPDSVVRLPSDPLGTLRRPWTDYCDRRVFSQGAIIERIDLRRGDETRQFQMDEQGRWQRLGSAAEVPEVGDLVNNDLRDLVGKNAVDWRQQHREQVAPTWTLQFRRRNGDDLGGLLLWQRGEGQPLVVQARPDKVAFELSPRLDRDLRALWQ